MYRARQLRPADAVAQRGARAGDTLVGAVGLNRGLRVRILADQVPGTGGPLVGKFLVLEAGDNRHTDALAPLVGRITDAAAVLAVLRKGSPSCVNVVNTSGLVIDPIGVPDGRADREPR